MSCKKVILASVAGGVTLRVNQNTTCGVSSTLRAGKGGLNNMNATLVRILTASLSFLGGAGPSSPKQIRLRALSAKLKTLFRQYRIRILDGRVEVKLEHFNRTRVEFEMRTKDPLLTLERILPLMSELQVKAVIDIEKVPVSAPAKLEAQAKELGVPEIAMADIMDAVLG